MPKCYDCSGLSMHVHLIKASKQLQCLKFNFMSFKRSRALSLALRLPANLSLASFEFHYKICVFVCVEYIYLHHFFLMGRTIEMKWMRSAFLTVQYNYYMNWTQALWQASGRAGGQANAKAIQFDRLIAWLQCHYSRFMSACVCVCAFLVWSVASYAIVSIDAI